MRTRAVCERQDLGDESHARRKKPARSQYFIPARKVEERTRVSSHSTMEAASNSIVGEESGNVRKAQKDPSVRHLRFLVDH